MPRRRARNGRLVTMTWIWAAVVALGLIIAGALYIRLRSRRSPHAYRAVIALAGCYFIAGALPDATPGATGKTIDVTPRRPPARVKLAAPTLPDAAPPPVVRLTQREEEDPPF
jgi:hypothetical protein